MIDTISGCPPLAETLNTSERLVKRSLLSDAQHRAPISRESQIVTTDPSARETFFSFPPAENATQELSGEKTGFQAPSVPAIGAESNEAIGRWKSCLIPSTVAANTIRLPFDEIVRGFP